MGRQIDKDAIEKANEERIMVLGTQLTSYNISGKLFETGIQ
jgi:hypothetical protein